MIANLEVNLSKNPTEREEINQEVDVLKNKRHEIMKNPDILVSKNAGRGSHSKKGPALNIKKPKTKRGVYTVNTFKVKELSQAEHDEYSSDEANCWGPPSPQDKASIQTQNAFAPPTDSQIASSIAAARRPSLPILDVGQIPLPPPINLPPPIRRHSIDSFPIRTPSFSLSGSTAYNSAPVIDFSQKLPAFNFNQTITISSLPCIEPKMNGSIQPILQDTSKSAFPEWFIAEKKSCSWLRMNKLIVEKTSYKSTTQTK